jgi:hypothetical protein
MHWRFLPDSTRRVPRHFRQLGGLARPSAFRRGRERRKMGVGVIVLALVPIAMPSSQVAFGLDDTYLQCTGSVSILREDGVQSVEKQEIAAHVIGELINFSGNALLKGSDIQICRRSTDDLYFDSQSCTGGPVDVWREREYGTLNKITGELHLTNEAPPRNKLPPLFLEGTFICKKVEPLIR